MNQARRHLLRGTVSGAVLSVAAAAGLLQPQSARAYSYNPDTPLARSLRALQGSRPESTTAIRIKAPDIAENGASVFVSFTCDLPAVDTVAIFVDRNPQPLVAAFRLEPEVLPELQMRVKFAETAQVWVVVRSAGQFYRAAKTVKLTMGGCGAGFN